VDTYIFSIEFHHQFSPYDRRPVKHVLIFLPFTIWLYCLEFFVEKVYYCVFSSTYFEEKIACFYNSFL